MDIYCEDSKCPICEQDMAVKDIYNKNCRNSCYSIETGYGYIEFYVVNKKVVGIWDDDNFIAKYLDRKKIIKEVEYWKQDDRYLMHILLNSGC